VWSSRRRSSYLLGGLVTVLLGSSTLSVVVACARNEEVGDSIPAGDSITPGRGLFYVVCIGSIG